MFTIDDCAQHNGLGLRVVERKSMVRSLNTGLRQAGEWHRDAFRREGDLYVYVNAGVFNVLELNYYRNNHELVSLTGEPCKKELMDGQVRAFKDL